MVRVVLEVANSGDCYPCPKCGSNYTQARGREEIDDKRIAVICTCHNCGRCWKQELTNLNRPPPSNIHTPA